MVSLGLRWPVTGSAGGGFVLALVAGTAVAVLLGSLTGEDPGPVWPTLVSLILWQPLIEELLFRGVLQGELRRFPRLRTGWFGVSPANCLAALAFATVHLINHPPLWAAATVVPGLVFGWSRDRSGSVLPAMLLHAAFNAGFFLAA